VTKNVNLSIIVLDRITLVLPIGFFVLSRQPRKRGFANYPGLVFDSS
jgi:hypothetical protein|tara:strand:- start:1027 stop:1167 length:141 start_codon:yes stop_codon:yes gene_type:complete